VALAWLHGGLSEYNISFEGMWIAFSPDLTARAAFLSLGRCFVINGGNGLDSKSSGPDWFGVNNSGFGAGSFHSFFIEVTTSYTKVNMDGRLVFQDGGVGMKNYLNNRDCQPLGFYGPGSHGPTSPRADMTGAMFGGFISGNGRTLFSRVEGQVRNVRLETEIPDPIAGSTTSPLHATAAAASTRATIAGTQGGMQSGGGGGDPGTTMSPAPTSVVARYISCNFKMTVNNAKGFVSDPVAKAGVQRAIANVSGVSPDKVQVKLEITTSRRLDTRIERLLTSGSVRVVYVIRLPVGSAAVAAANLTCS